MQLRVPLPAFGPAADRERKRESAVFQKRVPMPVGAEPPIRRKEMKKLLVVLLALGLIAAFSMPASAADVKFTGSYYVAGAYDNNPQLKENGFSQAYVYQQVRLKPIFQIAEGLTFTMRFDALEKQWGDARWVVAGAGYNGTSTSDKNGTRFSDKPGAAVGSAENIDIEQSYVTFATAMGTFQVGYQDTNAWGTGFGNSPGTAPGVTWSKPFGDFTLGFEWNHVLDFTTATTTATPSATVQGTKGYVDTDSDTYALMGVYKKSGTEVGLLWKWYLDKSKRQASNYTGDRHLFQPYAKLAFGPVYIETELSYMMGKNRKFDQPADGTDVKENSWSAYVKGSYKMGPAEVGALFAMVTGDDWTTDEMKGSLNCGYAWNPALILMNSDLKWWGGGNAAPKIINPRGYIYNPAFTQSQGVGSQAGDDAKSNTVWYNLYANFTATPKLTLGTALTYATVQTKKLSATTEADSDKLGTELDVTATYKLFDNLTYMVGAGYLWSGDYLKYMAGGASTPLTKVENNYVLVNKLTLNF